MTYPKDPNLDPNSPPTPSTDEPSWSSLLPQDGSFDVAGTGTWMAKRAMQVHPEIEPSFRATVRGLVGSGFSDQDIKALEDRALNQVDFLQLGPLTGIQAGVPLDLTGRQDRVVRDILGKMGSDDLAHRARDAYEQGIKGGKIRIH